MWINNLNPVLLHLGPVQIRWYGLVYVAGFFFAIWWLHHLSKRGGIQLTSDDIWDMMFYLMLGVLIGSRLFEVFWEPTYYLTNPLNFLKIWQGGMSFHGGFVGIITATYLYCKKKQLNFWQIADVMSFPTMFALAFGRIANFINGELVGRIWNGSWCVIFPNYDINCRHPSILYAAAQRFLLAGWLCYLTLKRTFKPGFIFWNFVLFEGVGRFIIDYWREDTLYFNQTLTMGQIFSSLMIFISLYILITKYSSDLKHLFHPSTKKQTTSNTNMETIIK